MNVISKLKLTSEKKYLQTKLNGKCYLAFKISQVPKRFAMTNDEIEKISHIPGIKKQPIKKWLCYKGYTLIELDLLNGRDLVHVKF